MYRTAEIYAARNADITRDYTRQYAQKQQDDHLAGLVLSLAGGIGGARAAHPDLYAGYEFTNAEAAYVLAQWLQTRRR